MYILASGMWFSKMIRQFFFLIDKIVYNFIPTIYDLLISIARTSILSQGDIASMADRIYKLLAVFMIFKVTFSLIMYVVNPDDFSDKNKGVGKLGTNIVISLALLVLTPYIFSYAYQLQTVILEDNSLGTLIFGEEADDNFLNTAGDNMAYITLTPFFTPNVSLIELYECTELVEKNSDDSVHFNESCSGVDSIDYEDLGDDTSMYALIDEGNFTEADLETYVAGVEANSLPLMFRQDMAAATTTKSAETDGEQEFIMDYKWGFSTVVGIVIVLLLVSFCMDVALRSIKLAFLQLIAPIPIISFVDPKSGKDGLFKKWYQMCFKTFISLFVRLLALYFAVYIIGKVADLKMIDIIDGSYVSNGFIAIFIIIGALMFVKQLPKILEGMGIKLDGGSFTLNPLKKIENDAIGGKQISKVGKGALKYTGRTAKGLGMAGLVGGSALITGHGFRGSGKAFMGAMKGEKFGKNFSNSYGAAKERHRQVEEMRANGVTPGEVRRENLRNFFSGTTRAEKVNQVESKAKAIQSSYDTIKNQAVACDSNDNNTLDRNGRVIKSAKTISKELDEMKKTQIDRNSFKDIEGKTAQQQFDETITSKNAHINELENKKKDYQNQTSKINMEVAEVKAKQANLKRSDFSNDNEYYEAYAACTQRLAVLDEQKKSYDVSAVEQEINNTVAERDAIKLDDFRDVEGKTADEQYAEAIAEQKDAIKEKEADLEYRINALANGMSTGVESADKVIRETKETMGKLAESVNKTGKEVDDNFVEISTDTTDVVSMMKQSKGATAQTTSGKMSDIKDVSKYTKQKKS